MSGSLPLEARVVVVGGGVVGASVAYEQWPKPWAKIHPPVAILPICQNTTLWVPCPPHR